MPLIYRAMNRFDKEDRRANKKVEKITSTDIDQALSSLKTGGVMGRIMEGVYAEVETIRAEHEAEEQAKREREERAAEQAKAKRKADQERQAKEVEKRRLAEEKAKAEQEKVKERDAQTRAAAAAATAKAKADREQAEKEQAEKHKADEAERKAAADAKKARDAETKAENERLAKEREAIKAQKALEAVYDTDCVHVFRLTSHERTFRETVLSENGRRFIPKQNQLALARQIRSEIDVAEKKSGRDLGSVTITSMIGAHLARLIGVQKDIDREEKDRLLRESAQKRVEEHWKNLRRGVIQAEGSLARLVDDQANWPYDTALFPMHTDDIDRIIDIGLRMQRMKKSLGY